MIIENCVLVLEAASAGVVGVTLAAVHVDERERGLSLAAFSEQLILNLLVLLLLDLVLGDEPSLESVLLPLRLAHVV